MYLFSKLMLRAFLGSWGNTLPHVFAFSQIFTADTLRRITSLCRSRAQMVTHPEAVSDSPHTLPTPRPLLPLWCNGRDS